jgi:AraC family transcriptional regulator
MHTASAMAAVGKDLSESNLATVMTLGDCGTLRFAIRMAGNAAYPAGSTFGPRLHQDFEFVWISEGTVLWEVGGVTLPAPPGTLLLGRPGMRDHFRWDPRRRTRHGFVHFQITAGHATLPPPDTWPLHRALPAGDILRPLFGHLAHLLAQHPPGWNELAQGALRQILAGFISGATATAHTADPAEHPLVAKVFTWVQELWQDGAMDPPTLGDCARAAGVTRAHLARVFKAEVGMGPVEALRTMRLDRAASLLSRTNLPVAEIATLTGFPNAFHFSKTFRAAFGRPPRELRAAVLAGELPPYTRLVRTRPLGNGTAR